MDCLQRLVAARQRRARLRGCEKVWAELDAAQRAQILMRAGMYRPELVGTRLTSMGRQRQDQLMAQLEYEAEQSQLEG